MLIIKNGDQLIMKKASSLNENFEEDIAYAKRTENAFKRIKESRATRLEFDRFLEQLKQW